MPELNMDYEIGRIHSRLDGNDDQHKQIMSMLVKIDEDLSTFKSKSIEDTAQIKGKVTIISSIAGLIASAMITLVAKLIKF